MTNINRGKDFENRFKLDWNNCFQNSFLIRLNDNTTGYKNVSRNPSDFIGFINGRLFLIEVKSHYGNTFNFKSDFRQYDELLKYKNIEGVYPCIIIWFIDHDKVLFANIKDIESMINQGKKSINIKDFAEYNIKEVPSIKLRTFLKSDYSFLKNV